MNPNRNESSNPSGASGAKPTNLLEIFAAIAEVDQHRQEDRSKIQGSGSRPEQGQIKENANSMNRRINLRESIPAYERGSLMSDSNYIEKQGDQPENRSQYFGNTPELKEAEHNLAKIYRYPAIYGRAVAHQEGYKFGYKAKRLFDKSEVPRCPCCRNLMINQSIPLCYPTYVQLVKNQQVFLLPTGVSMYFTFIKMVMIYLFIRLIIFDMWAMIFSLNGEYCSNIFLSSARPSEHCVIATSGYNLRSLANEWQLQILDYLNLLFIIVSIVYFQVCRKIQYQQKNRLRIERYSEDQFSIYVENIPTIICEDGLGGPQGVKFRYQIFLKRHFEKKFDFLRNAKMEDEASLTDLEKQVVIQIKKLESEERKDIVSNVSISYNLSELDAFDKLREEYMKGYVEQIKKGKSDSAWKYLEKIKVLNFEYVKYCDRARQADPSFKEGPSFKFSHFNGKAVISFQYQHFRDYIMSRYQSDPSSFQICDQVLSIRHAYSPEDIQWSNLQITQDARNQYFYYSLFVLAMTLIVTFLIFLAVNAWESYVERLTFGTSFWEKVKKYLPVACSAAITTGTNFVIRKASQVMADKEKPRSKSDKLKSLIWKIVIAQTANNALIYLILYMMNPINPLGQYGFANKVIALVAVSGMLSGIVLNIISPLQTIQGIYYYFTYKKQSQAFKQSQKRKNQQFERNSMNLNNSLFMKSDSGIITVDLFQKQLNKELQHPQFDYAERYAFYIVFTFTLAIYSFIVPNMTPVLLMIFGVCYWIDKFNLFRRFSSPVDLDYNMGRFMFKVFQFSAFLYSVSYFVWDINIHYEQSTRFRLINLVSLLISILYLIYSLGPRCLRNMILRWQLKPNKISYHQCKAENKFNKTYKGQNPITQLLEDTDEQGKKKSKLKMRRKKSLTDYYVTTERIQSIPTYQQTQINDYREYMGQISGREENSHDICLMGDGPRLNDYLFERKRKIFD